MESPRWGGVVEEVRSLSLLMSVGLLAGILEFGLPSLPAMRAVQSPTPTIKACHICDEGLPVETQMAPPVVRAVLFWEEGCPYCSGVIDYVLPPLQQEYGAQLEIVLLQVVTQEDVDRLHAVASTYGIQEEDVIVPFLILGDRSLMGAADIRDELPGLIAHQLALGGAIPPQVEAPTPSPEPMGAGSNGCGLATPCVDDNAPTPAPSITFLSAPSAEQSPSNGFALAVAVMTGMVAALVVVGAQVWRRVQQDDSPPASATHEKRRSLALLALSLMGLGVAGYLAYIETQMVQAACGPVGDCNAVQASPYARLFGVLPVGVLGMLGYLAMLGAWGSSRLRRDWLGRVAPPAVFGMALFGTLFSFYLTALELFVIKAVCMWCVISAVVMTLLLLLSLDPALRSLIGKPDAEEEPS